MEMVILDNETVVKFTILAFVHINDRHWHKKQAHLSLLHIFSITPEHVYVTSQYKLYVHINTYCVEYTFGYEINQSYHNNWWIWIKTHKIAHQKSECEHNHNKTQKRMIRLTRGSYCLQLKLNRLRQLQKGLPIEMSWTKTQKKSKPLMCLQPWTWDITVSLYTSTKLKREREIGEINSVGYLLDDHIEISSKLFYSRKKRQDLK